MGNIRSVGILRFEEFELDVRTAELRNVNGKSVRLSEQPLRILMALVERPGELVLREDLRKRLWPNDTVVEFEHSISAAINRLRQALGDSAENPKFVETLARRGYRWKTSVEWQPPQLACAPTPSVDGNLIGKRISHYRVLEILGGGSMGVVYKAEDLKLGRLVALKFLPEEMADDPVAHERFEREARALSALDHPNICAIYEFGEHERHSFLAMQFLKGQTLREKIETGGPTPVPQLLDISLQITRGLEAAHERGILHRDIKPANIFLTDNGVAKLLDFGIAKWVAGAEILAAAAGHNTDTARADRLSLTRTGSTVGTAAYMSPEQVRGEPVDARTDLFSFGLVIYEMATGRRAFAGDTALVLHHAITNQTPAPVRGLNPLISPRIEAIINKAIRKDRDTRYQNASEIHSDLERLNVRKQARTFPWWAAVAGMIVASLVVVNVWFASRRPSSVPPPPDFKLRQLTANSPEKRVVYGHMSPDGKYLAYVDLGGIRIKAIDSDEVHTLALPESLRNRNIELHIPTWFPDSARLIINVHPPIGPDLLESEADEDLSVWEFSLHGRPPRLMRERAWADAISPDGMTIAFRANPSRSGREIWLMDSQGGNARKLFAGHAAGGLNWSPDGRSVWYPHSDGPEVRDADLKLLSFPWEKDHVVAGSTPTDITPPFGMDNTHDVSILPDDRFLYSVRERSSIGGETCNFWTAQRDPQTGRLLGKPQQLTHWTGFCMGGVSFSDDGKRLAFLEWSGHPALYVADLRDGGTRIINERHFTGSESTELWVGWITDSESLIFSSDRTGRPGIYRQALDTDIAELLVSAQDGLAPCCVSPDGRWLIYRVHQGLLEQPGSTPEEVMRVPVTGGAAEEVFKVKRLKWWGCARATSNVCVVAENTEDAKHAIISSFDPLKGRGPELTRIALEPNRDWALALSPDGKRLALIRGPGNPLQILTLKGELLQEIGFPEWNPAGPIEWAPDGKGLFVATRSPDGATLKYASLRGEVHIMRENRGGNYGPGLPSPDGRRIAIVGTAQKANMWLMENF